MANEKIYQGRIISLYVEKEGDHVRDIVRHIGAVAMIAITDREEILLVKQHRHPVNRSLLELPAGCLEPGEDLAESAQRELREEVGMRAGELRHLTSFYPSPGFCDEHVHLYLARDLSHDPLVADDTDLITVAKLPLKSALEAIMKGEIQDGKTILGILYYQQWRSHA